MSNPNHSNTVLMENKSKIPLTKRMWKGKATKTTEFAAICYGIKMIKGYNSCSQNIKHKRKGKTNVVFMYSVTVQLWLSIGCYSSFREAPK